MVYFRKYENKQELKQYSNIREIQLQSMQKEIEQVKISSQKLAILRHDMRHHLNIIYTQLQNGHPEKAQDYIKEISSAYDDPIIASYSKNEGITVPLIFLTSSKEFALESYEVKALNYLIKPIDSLKLFSVLDDFLKDFERSAETFTAHTADGFCKITLNDVDCLEAQNKWVLVYLSDGKILKMREQFSKCEGIFTPEKGFFKCHRSYIINLSRVRQFTRTQITTAVSSAIPISRNSYSAFKDAYFAFMFDSGTNFTID